MNQKARKNGTSPIEWDFYKLLNYSNFGISCRNNIDNWKLEPIQDKVGEISYVKKFNTIFDNENDRDFYSPDLWEKKIIKSIVG